MDGKIDVRCPGCQTLLRVSAAAGGQLADCPSCKTQFRVPQVQPSGQVGPSPTGPSMGGPLPPAAPAAAGPGGQQIISCGQCGTQMSIPAGMAGQQLSCPKCGWRFNLGAAQPAVAP